jgi:hypothetical protein
MKVCYFWHCSLQLLLSDNYLLKKRSLGYSTVEFTISLTYLRCPMSIGQLSEEESCSSRGNPRRISFSPQELSEASDQAHSFLLYSRFILQSASMTTFLKSNIAIFMDPISNSQMFDQKYCVLSMLYWMFILIAKKGMETGYTTNISKQITSNGSSSYPSVGIKTGIDQ